MKRFLVLPIVLLATSQAFAHAGHLHGDDAGIAWTWDARVLLPLTVSASLYGLGAFRLWRCAGFGRGVRPWQATSFAAGWLLLVGALVAPLHALGERLFTAHMIEHEILMVLAAPLLVLARPAGAMLWALPPGWRRRLGALARARPIAALWRRLLDPAVATGLHAAAIWVWHLPTLYQTALQNSAAHWLQHSSFFLSALLFWWALLGGRARQRGYGAAIFYLFATALHTSFLGILIALARRPLYPSQTEAASAFGLTPLEDQQLAGVIMWIPGGMGYALAALALAGLWIRHSGAQANSGGIDAVPAR